MCEKTACPGGEQCIEIEPLRPQILPKTGTLAGTAAHQRTGKFVDALPIFR